MYLSLLFPQLVLDMQDCVIPTIRRLNRASWDVNSSHVVILLLFTTTGLKL